MAKKIALMSVIVLATIQCLIDGKSKMFLPSDEPQDLPAPEAKEAIDRGLAKAAPVNTSTRTKKVTGGTPSAVSDSDDDEPIEGSVNV